METKILDVLKKDQRILRKHKIVGLEMNERPNSWRLKTVIILSFVILILTQFSLLKTAVILLLLLPLLYTDWLLEWFFALGFDEGIPSSSATVTRWLVYQKVKAAITNKLRENSFKFKHASGDKGIKVPAIKVVLDEDGDGYTGFIDVELLPATLELLTNDKMIPLLNAALTLSNEPLVVEDSNPVSGGTVQRFNLKDLRVTHQLKVHAWEDIPAKLAFDEQTEICGDAHLAISGRTGTGKTMLEEFVIASALKAGDRVVILDPKMSDLSLIDNSVPDQVKVAWLKNDMLAALEEATTELEQRQSAYHDKQQEFTPLTILMDELPSFLLLLNRKEKDQVLTNIKLLALMGRQLGIRVVLAAQQFGTTNAVPSEVREQLAVKVLLGQSMPEEQRFLFGSNTVDSNSFTNERQGLLSLNSGAPKVVTFPEIKIDLINAINSFLGRQNRKVA